MLLKNKPRFFAFDRWIFAILVILIYRDIQANETYEDLIVSTNISKNKLEVYVNPRLKAKYLVSDFFAVYDDEAVDLTTLDYTLATLPFVSNIVTVVWISGEKFSIDAMDEDIFYSFERIKKVFQKLYPKTQWLGEIVPKKLVKNYSPRSLKDPNEHIALLYSAGLDSTSSSFYHHDKKQLLITAWGQWDIPLKKPELWAKRKQHFIEFAFKYGHTNSFVKSNYSAFLNWEVLGQISLEIVHWREDANEGIGMAGLVAPILIAHGYSDLYIASSFTWNYPYPSAANPFVDNNIRFAHNFRVKHDQFGFTRIDKLATMSRVIRENNLEIPILKVCGGQKSYNCCGDCNKCLHTIMALLVLGEDLEPWGFPIGVDEAVSRVRDYLKQDLDYWVRWNFLVIKRRIKKILARGRHVSDKLRWFVHHPLNENVAFMHIKYKEFVNWNHFKSLAPKDFKIPMVHQLRLDQDE